MVSGTVKWFNKATWFGFVVPSVCIVFLFGCASPQKAVTIIPPVEPIQAAKPKTVPAPLAPKAVRIPLAPKLDVRAVKSPDGLIDGEIVGTPATDSKFVQLHIGMTLEQVENLIGRPTDTDSRITGKQYQPFYFGGDTQRTEAFYIKEGQLTFSNAQPDNAADTLIRIMVNTNETGIRRIVDTKP